ncbi:MAG: MBL fold metallo-hydrolase [Saprospiraceae bacterium]|nr:MBL fold metallo-hydrolase [Saprospiraceae bacterium]|tara:strand:- start:1879 stop:2721 length:843 start_codon:yes stop_codon:yes gene_type:complete
MKITIWGARGSLPSPSPETNEVGGNTSCVQVESDDTMIVLDAGSGIQRLNGNVPSHIKQIDILLTHLHLDHIMGLGFFSVLYNPKMVVNIWGPTGVNFDLESRLTRYLSPPLFPIRLKDLPCQLNLFEVNHSAFNIGDLKISSAYVCHPGPTLGFRIEGPSGILTYIPDHEPSLGSSNFPNVPEWTSGCSLAQNSDILLHDAQYTSDEYKTRIGWGHSTMKDAILFAEMSKTKKLLFFHHDPGRTDNHLNSLLKKEINSHPVDFEIGLASEGDQFIIGEY